MKKKTNTREKIREEVFNSKSLRLFLNLLFVVGGFTAGFFLFKIFFTLISNPILTAYNAAYNWYEITGDPSQFSKAANFAKEWIRSWIYMLIGFFVLILHRIIKKRKLRE